jgi:hypothetical protein
MKKMKTVVLLHGYNVNELNWEDVVWGRYPDQPGRIPTAIAVALEEKTNNLILFGSSVGRDVGAGFESSGKCMVELLEKRFEELKNFTVLSVLRNFSRSRAETLIELIEEGPVKVKNTLDEMKEIKAICEYRGYNKLVAVSSPDHISRIMRDGLSCFAGSPLALHFSVRASNTLYTMGDGITPIERARVSNVVIAEPRSAVGPYFQRMFGINNNPEALLEIDSVLKKYGK